MNEDVKIRPDDFQDIQQINWDGPIQLADDNTLINMGEMCPRYLPCPICRQCCNKASHLFEKCGLCGIPLCVHSDAQKNMLIKRKNFALIIPKEAMEALDDMAANVRNQRSKAI